MATRINFDGYGKLSARDKDNFKRYEEKTFSNSSWFQKSYKPQFKCGNDSILLTMRDGNFTDRDKTINVRLNGKTKDSYEEYSFSFADRLTDPNLKRVKEYQKYILDMCEDRGALQKVRDAVRKAKDNKLTTNDLKDCGVSNKEELFAKYKKLSSKRQEFVTMYDFISAVKEMIDSGEYKDATFRIRGEYHIEFNENDGRFYSTVIPQRIYLVEDRVGSNTINPKFFFGEDAIEENKADSCLTVHGYVGYYERKIKGEAFAPLEFNIPVNFEGQGVDQKKINAFYKLFKAKSGEIRAVNLVLSILAGAQKEEIKYEDLTEEQQMYIDLGLLDIDTICRESGEMYGKFRSGLEFVHIGEGSSKGSEETAYTPADMRPYNEKTDSSDDDDDDLSWL